MNPTLIPENKFLLETNCVAKNYLWHRNRYIHKYIYIHTCKSKKSGFTCVFGTTKNMKTLAHKGHSDTLLWSKILTIPYKTITMPEN